MTATDTTGRLKVDLPWSGQHGTTNRNRRLSLARERDAMHGQITAELTIRRGRALTASERALVEAFCGTKLALSDLDRRIARGQFIRHATYSRLTDNLLRFAAKLGLEKPAKATKPKADAANVTTLSDYLNSKAAAGATAEAVDDD